jgi:hypothetical protein
MRRRWLGLLLLAVTASVVAQDADSKLEKADEARRFFGIGEELLRADLSTVKVAILAEGLSEGPIRDGKLDDAKYLPETAEWIDRYPGVETDPPRRAPIGRRAAQIVWALTGYSPNGPHFRIYNANGLRSFREAVKSVVDWKADVVVSLVNFPGMGNFDGKGFVNKLVETATDEGIVWLQSVGEFRRRVVNVDVAPLAKAPREMVRVARLRSRADRNPVRLFLSWNAYAPGRASRPTDKDLDLFVFEPGRAGGGEPLARSELVQAPGDDAPEGNLPIETLSAELYADEKPFEVYVAYRSGEFSAARDRVRLTVVPEKQPYLDADAGKMQLPVEVLEPSDSAEVMVPADNQDVVTVGDKSEFSSRGPTADGRTKPDIVLEDYPALFSDKAALGGPHAATAYLAAAVVALRANAPGLRTSHVLRIARETARGDGKERSQFWKTPTVAELRKLFE